MIDQSWTGTEPATHKLHKMRYLYCDLEYHICEQVRDRIST